MKSFTIFSVLLLAGCKAVAGEYRPKEELVLADCGIGTRPNGDSTSRQFAYYSAGRSPGRDTNGPDHWVNPDMIANVPWDGSYPWRNSGVDVKLPNNDVFHIWINPAIKDWSSSNKQYAGGASHIFEPHPFQCWGGHGRHVFNLADGTKCTSAYICGHETDAVPQPPKQENRVKFTMSNTQVTVRVQGTNKEVESWLPRNALGHANDAIEGIQCKSQSYQIGSDCKISFDCKFGAPQRAGTLARVLTDAVAPEVAKTKATKKGRYPGKCRPNGGCEPDYEFEYTEYQYPIDGTVLVSHKTPGDDNSEGLQNYMTWKIQCSKDGLCGPFCSDFKKFSDVVGGIVSAVPNLVCLGCSE